MTLSRRVTPVIAVSVPEYVDEEPDHAAIGKPVDEVIKRHFLGQDILLRVIGSIEHPDKNVDELIAIIKELGTDRYDPQRIGDRYDNNENRHIDFFALRFTVTADAEMFSQFTWPLYHWGITSRGFPIRGDIAIVYDPAKVDRVAFTYAGRESEGSRDDGFAFKAGDRADALMAIIRID